MRFRKSWVKRACLAVPSSIKCIASATSMYSDRCHQSGSGLRFFFSVLAATRVVTADIQFPCFLIAHNNSASTTDPASTVAAFHGDTIAVWGCGPVGQFAMKSAFLLGAERV